MPALRSIGDRPILKSKYRQYWYYVQKLASLKLIGVKDDNNDDCNTAKSKFQADKSCQMQALMYHGGSTHERWLRESSCLYILAYYLSA